MIKPDFSEVIESCISAYKETATFYIYNNQTGEQINIGIIISEQNFLPVFFEWTAFCSIRPNGEMIWCDYDNPQKMEVESDERIRNIAMVKAIEKFPELSPFLPERKSDDLICPYCETVAETRESMPENLRGALNCYCGGLGWIPKNGL